MDSAKTICVDGKDYELPNDVQSWGSLYHIPLSLLDLKEEENPRRLGATDDAEGHGLDKDSMAELMEWIQEKGLQFPLICYWKVVDGVLRPRIADGERRYHCLEHLVEQDKTTFCPVSGKKLPGSEVYSRIPCRVVVGDENDALEMAFMLHSTNVGWGDAAVVKVVQKLRDNGVSDAEILKRIKKKQQWLAETDSLLGLDQETFNYLLAGKINRSLGLRFAAMEDVERRHEYLNETYDEAIDEYEVEASQADEDLDRAISDQEVVESNLAEAVASEADEDTVEELQGQVEKAKKKTASKRKKADDVKGKKPKAGTRHLTKVAKVKKDRSRDMTQQLGKKGIQQHLQSIQELILNEGNDADGNPVQSIEALDACETCYKAILNGEEDIVKALREADVEE